MVNCKEGSLVIVWRCGSFCVFALLVILFTTDFFVCVDSSMFQANRDREGLVSARVGILVGQGTVSLLE